MPKPSNIRFGAHIEGQGDYPSDPRLRVGTHEDSTDRHYASKEAIDPDTRYKGMMTVDDNGVLWILKGGILNTDWLDVFGTMQTLLEKNQANGYAGLDSSGKLSTAVLPALAIGDTHVEASEAAMLALVAQIGDVCKRTDNGNTYILQNADATVLANWVDISSNFSGVESVNGQTGQHITLTADHIAETVSRLWVSPAEKTTWNGKQDALNFDSVPTTNSPNPVTSGGIFDYIKGLVSSIETKTWAGSDADGNNRFNLAAEEKDIEKVIFFREGGIIQDEGTHFTVDVNKRYIEFPSVETTKTYTVKYFSDLPLVSLTSIQVANVIGLLVNGKIDPNLIPNAGTAADVTHNAEGGISIELAGNCQFPVNASANITSFNLTNGIRAHNYDVVFQNTGTISFKIADDWATGQNYVVGNVRRHPTNNRYYKVPTGQGHLSGADMDTDIAAGKWVLWLTTEGDNDIRLSTDDMDILHVKAIKDDLFKIIPIYGS